MLNSLALLVNGSLTKMRKHCLQLWDDTASAMVKKLEPLLNEVRVYLLHLLRKPRIF